MFNFFNRNTDRIGNKKLDDLEWKHINTFAVGGLENVGFAPGTDLLLVLSSQGEGIFDCRKGEKLARVNNDLDWWDRINRDTYAIKGFDILDDIEIRTCGMYGMDIFRKTTSDGWTLIITEPQPDDKPFEKFLVKRIYLMSPDKKRKTLVGMDGACELRAFGFSETENTFIIALTCDLIVYRRE